MLKQILVSVILGLGLAGFAAACSAPTATPGSISRPPAATLPAITTTQQPPMTMATYATSGIGGTGTPPFTGTILIADAGNNRVIEVTLDKQIVWSFPITGSIPATRTFRYPDDAFFSPDGKLISINEENNHVISVIDYATRKLVWQFGQPSHPGSDLKHLHTPDDAHFMLDGQRIVVADIMNCRILIIPWDQANTKVIGNSEDCSGKTPRSFARPNSAFPLLNGHLLVTEIHTHRVSEIDLDGNAIRTVILPITYPSDAFLTPRDTLIVASYTPRGKVIEIDWQGNVLWTFPPKGSNEWLNRSSIARELPSGNILIVDDHRHRVIVVDHAGQILWQYGKTGTPGKQPGYLNTPDGFDWHPPQNP